MSFKFNKDAASDKKYIDRPGVFEVTIVSANTGIKGTRASFVASLVMKTSDGEYCTKDVYKDPDSKGNYTILEQFMASTCTDIEAQKYSALPESFTPDEEFLKLVADRSVGRRVNVDIRPDKWIKDGVERISHKVAFFRRHPKGPSDEPF